MRGQDAREGTVLFELLEALRRTAAHNAQDQVAPVTVLWTDKDRQWQPLTLRLRALLPHFLTFGPYRKAGTERMGPAVWIRCMIARTLPEVDWSEDQVPVIYLPGVSRHELRAVESCARELQPLSELQYRGVWFTQENTRDWTVYAFLTSARGGLGLDISSDRVTREAVLHALGKLVDAPVAELRGRRLQAEYFQALLQPDLVRQLLRWLDDPVATRADWTSEEWEAFRGACRERYRFDPESDGELVGAEMLGAREGTWGAVWERFAEVPSAYSHLPSLLGRAKPVEEGLPLFFHRDSWPQFNEQAEEELRQKLLTLGILAPAAAATEIENLEASHSARRAWVWAKLGKAPLAQALEPLAQLARASMKKIGGQNAQDMATAYVTEGWRADAAMLDALASVTKASDVDAIKIAIRATYTSWLEAGAEHLQNLLREHPLTGQEALASELAALGSGTCILFADGLRSDVGKRLEAALQGHGFLLTETWRWVPLPPVTPTAKPAASPVADLVAGNEGDGELFQPGLRATGQALTVERFRKLLSERGFQVLSSDETGDPAGRAWTEYGAIDQRGHDEGWKLARRITEEVNGLVERIQGLLEAGWREVWVVTDHGWLLLPGGLPKVEMPHYLVESRWNRCGALKPGSKVDLPTVPWYWNPDVSIVVAPGIGTFRDRTEFSHGGVSLQECVVLNLVVRPAQLTGPTATLDVVRWAGLRCRVRVSGAGAGWHVDLRTKGTDPSSSLARGGEPRPVGLDGEGSLIVDDPDREGVAAIVVLLAPDGRVVARRNTIIGGEDAPQA